MLTPERRTALLAWLRASGSVAIEDDYDAEHRYDRAAVGALQGLAPDRVVYAGSASKVLAPALRIGWLVVPDGLLGPVVEQKVLSDRGSARIDQLAFAGFLLRGDFDRHLRHHRRLYQRRREALLDAFAQRLPELTVSGAAAGLHFVLHLPPQHDEATVVAAARARGIALDPLRATNPGLVVGYANLPEALAPAAVEALATVLR